ncbi:MAG: serine/threonine protein kinase, partial [Spirulina sp. SIO3F2]|nr:serine/threonine protein kinase [Spirulina sp. SIO3F2]
MVYCLNPQCAQPQNDPEHRFCITCGSVLALGDRHRAIKPLGSNQRCQTWLATDDRDPYTPYCVLKQIALRTPEEFTQVVEVFQVL